MLSSANTTAYYLKENIKKKKSIMAFVPRSFFFQFYKRSSLPLLSVVYTSESFVRLRQGRSIKLSTGGKKSQNRSRTKNNENKIKKILKVRLHVQVLLQCRIGKNVYRLSNHN